MADKDRILADLDTLTDAVKNIKDAPGFKIAILIRDALVVKGMDVDLAEEVAIKLQVQVSSELLNDKLFILLFVDKLTNLLLITQQSVLQCFNTKTAYLKALETLRIKAG